MGKKREVTRKYNFADSWLISLCNTVNSFVFRDILEFAAYNIDAATVDAYREEINEFGDLPTDIELAGQRMIKTEDKNTEFEKVKSAIRGIMARIAFKYEINTATYKRFGTKGMDEMNDFEILFCGRRVVRVATKYQAEFEDVGLTLALIADLNTKCQSFEDALQQQQDAISNRDIATEKRIEKGNLLYDKLIKYCRTGQQIWVEVSEAGYNDYIIYTSGGKLAKPIELVVDAGYTQNVINQEFQAEDKIKIEITGDAKLKFCLAVDETTACVSGVELNAGETRTVTASELGDVATCQFLNCTNNDAVQGSFKIRLL